MDFGDLELLVAVAEGGSLRRAAQIRDSDVATVSRRIARLESELGVLLFERGRAGVRPTLAGVSTLELARKALAGFDAIRRNASASGRAEQGRLRLGTHLPTIGPRLRSLIRRWRKQHPGVVLELSEVDDRALSQGIRERDFDVAIAFSPALPPEVATQQLWAERLFLALPTGHPLVAAQRIGWSDLRSVPIFDKSLSGSAAPHNILSRLVGPKVDFRASGAGTLNLLNLVALGEGAVFALNHHREITIEGVVLRPIDEPDATISLVLAWCPEVEDAVAGSFVAFLRDYGGRDSRP